MNQSVLENVINERVKNKVEIRYNLKEFFSVTYGIEDIFIYIDKYFNSNSFFDLYFARHVVVPNIEQLSFLLLNKYLRNYFDCDSTVLTFHNDSFTSSNKYKKSLLKKRLIVSGKEFATEKIVERPFRFYYKNKLAKITTKNGCSLIEYYEHLLKSVEVKVSTNNNKILFLRQCFFLAFLNNKGLPESVFIESYENKEMKLRTSELDFKKIKLKNIRPPADWHYLFYLLLFIDGDRALVSTTNDNEEVKSWFQKNCDLLYEICGFRPLIIDIPDKVVTSSGYESNLLEINTAVFEPGWQERIVDPEGEDLDLFEVYEFYAKQLLELRPIKK